MKQKNCYHCAYYFFPSKYCHNVGLYIKEPENEVCEKYKESEYRCTFCHKEISEAECSVAYTCPVCKYCANHLYTEGD